MAVDWCMQFIVLTILMLCIPINADTRSIIDINPDHCGYKGTVQYTEGEIPTVVWSLVQCPKEAFEQLKQSGVVRMEQDTQTVTIDLQHTNTTVLELCGLLQGYFDVFNADWFLPTNIALQTNFNVILGDTTTLSFSLSQNSNPQSNLWVGLYSSNNLAYTRNNVEVPCIGTTGDPGFLDVVFQYGVQDMQHVDKTSAKYRQVSFAQGILKILNGDASTAEAVLQSMPGNTEAITAAIFDFLIKSSVLYAVSEDDGSSVWDQWDALGKIQLNNVQRPVVGLKPHSGEYVRFLLSQFANGELEDVWNLRDLFCNPKYWPFCTTQSIDTLSVNSVPLYEAPLLSEPQTDQSATEAAKIISSALTTGKARSVFETVILSMQSAVDQAVQSATCSRVDQVLDACIPISSNAQFNYTSLACSVDVCSLDFVHPYNHSMRIPTELQLDLPKLSLSSYLHETLSRCLIQPDNNQTSCVLASFEPLLLLVLNTDSMLNGYSIHSALKQSDANCNNPSQVPSLTTAIVQNILMLLLRTEANRMNVLDSYQQVIATMWPDYQSVNHAEIETIRTQGTFVALLADIVRSETDICETTAVCSNANSAQSLGSFANSISLATDVSTSADLAFGMLAYQLQGLRNAAQISASIISTTLGQWFSLNNEVLVQGETYARITNALIGGSPNQIFDAASNGFLSAIAANRTIEEAFVEKVSIISSLQSLGNENCNGEQGNLSFTSFMPFSVASGDLSVTFQDNGKLGFRVANILDPINMNSTFSAENIYNCSTVNSIALGVWNDSYYAAVANDTLVLIIPQKGENARKFYGTYVGSSEKNKFYATQSDDTVAAQSCTRNSTKPLSLIGDYQYMLTGNDGDDEFFLGSRETFAVGGNGHDLYFASKYGTQCTIDNSAQDELSDSLYLDVSFDEVICSRIGDHLVITYCSSHHLEILNWFINPQNHLVIVTSDGVQLGVADMNTNYNNISISLCYPVALDASDARMDVDLTIAPWLHVQSVIADKGFVRGNAKDNYILSSPDGAVLSGGAGADTYVISRGRILVDNFDEDLTQDLIILPSLYSSLNIAVFNDTGINVSNDNGLSIIFPAWLASYAHQHAWFLSSDSVPFEIIGTADSLSKRPLLVDHSHSEAPVVVDVSSASDLVQIVVVKGSPYADHITGNSLTNYIYCAGSDVMIGGPQSDVYVFSQTCLSAAINNYDTDETLDVLLIPFKFSDLYFSANASDLLVGSYENGTVVTLTDWFSDAANRHLIIATSDGVTSMLPNTTSDMTQWKNTPKPVEIDLPASCDCTVSGQSKTYDLSQPPYQSVTRFSSESTLCSYIVIGNSLDNYMDPGQGNPSSLQYLEGGDGADAYVIGVNYGLSNQINNIAYDGKMDLLLLGIQSQFLSASLSGQQHVQLSSTHNGDNVSVLVYNYLTNASYQHLLVQTIDKTLFVITDSYPYLKPIIVDRSDNPYAVQMNTSQASVVYGSRFADNMIEGSNTKAQRIVGGNGNDILQTNALNALLEGLTGNDELVGSDGIDTILGGDGNDKIVANDGDDVLYGGGGQDNMDGGAGQDTIVFAGDAMLSAGVNVSLRLGTGFGADADGDEYSHIESIYGSEFSDVLEGSDGDNTLAGYGGDDVIVPLGGVDMLYGGAGKDVYDLSSASGWKGIANFATDGLQDIILINDSKYPKRCNYSQGNDSYFHYGPQNESILAPYQSNSSESLNVVIWNWMAGDVFQHLSTCGLVCDTPVVIEKEIFDSVDASINTFKSSSVMTVTSVSSTSISIGLKPEILQLENAFRIDLVYVCDSGHLSILPNAFAGNLNLTINGLDSGVMCTFTLTLLRCSQVLAKSFTLNARTKPKSPSDLHVTIYRSTVEAFFDPVYTDYNYLLYEYKCFANSGNISTVITGTVNQFNVGTCIMPRLEGASEYEVMVESIAGTICSELSEDVTATTSTAGFSSTLPTSSVVTTTATTSTADEAITTTFGETTITSFNGTTSGNESNSRATTPHTQKMTSATATLTETAATMTTRTTMTPTARTTNVNRVTSTVGQTATAVPSSYPPQFTTTADAKSTSSPDITIPNLTTATEAPTTADKQSSTDAKISTTAIVEQSTTTASHPVTTTTAVKSTTKSPGCNEMFCSTHQGQFPITTCSSVYCECSNGYAYVMPCPGGLYYNAATKQCDYKQNNPGCVDMAVAP